MMLLRHWFDFLFPPRDDELTLRTMSLDTFLAHVHPQVVAATRPATTALLPFSDIAVRSTIHEAKYHGSERAFQFLATALAEYLRDGDETFRNVIIVPIPLGKARRKERGFNQIEEIIKRSTTGLMFEVDTTLLERTRETISQISLPRYTREINMRGAFQAIRPVDPARTYLVIDDVITTGATLQAAIDSLKQAGAKHIAALALAH